MIFIKRNIVCLVICISAINGTYGKSIMVSSVDEFKLAQETAKSGDTIVWKSGKYSDIILDLKVNGVVFRSIQSGATIFTGSSSLAISGSTNIVSGFQFVGGKIKGDIVDILGSNNKIEHLNFDNYDSHYYLRVRPNCQYNKISYCNFESKPETQESSVVQIEASETMIGYHVLSYCSFRNHTAPEGAGGDYGIEALRIGYSYQRMFTSRTIVEYCYFEKCNGDYEIISCKARENLIRYNTFNNNGQAHLTLRHGSLNMVYGNFFLNGAGVRIKEGQNQSVVNNYFDTGDRFSINIQNHHFDPVDTVIIANNTFISQGDLILGGKGDYPPKYVLLANNLFSTKINSFYSEETKTESWIGNVLQEGNSKEPSDYFRRAKFEWVENASGFYTPDFRSEFDNNIGLNSLKIFNIPELDDDYTIKKDIMMGPRVKELPGSYIPDKTNTLKPYANKGNTGPEYLLKN